jgi:hypothetical protein
MLVMSAYALVATVILLMGVSVGLVLDVPAPFPLLPGGILLALIPLIVVPLLLGTYTEINVTPKEGSKARCETRRRLAFLPVSRQ